MKKLFLLSTSLFLLALSTGNAQGQMANTCQCDSCQCGTEDCSDDFQCQCDNCECGNKCTCMPCLCDPCNCIKTPAQ